MPIRVYMGILVIAGMLLPACQSSSTDNVNNRRKKDPAERGVLSEYVNAPLERAEGVDDVANARNDAYEDALDELGDE